MAARWIVKRGENEEGPFTSQELKLLANSGQLRSTDWVRKDDSEGFVLAEKMKGLFQSHSLKRTKQKRRKTDASELVVAEIIDDRPPEETEVIAEYYKDQYEAYETHDEDLTDHRRHASQHGNVLNSTRGSRKRRLVSQNSRTKSKVRRKKASHDEDIEGPWQKLISGLLGIAMGVGFFLWIGPGDVKLKGSGLGGLLFVTLHEFGGRWAILGFFILGALIYFWESFKSFSGR